MMQVAGFRLGRQGIDTAPEVPQFGIDSLRERSLRRRSGIENRSDLGIGIDGRLAGGRRFRRLAALRCDGQDQGEARGEYPLHGRPPTTASASVAAQYSKP
ncbi:MAG: hypothetical protein ACREEP_10965 [Dongiaceae bacterium]